MKTVSTPEFISFFAFFFFNLSVPLGFKQKLLFGLVKIFSDFLRKRLKGFEPVTKGRNEHGITFQIKGWPNSNGRKLISCQHLNNSISAL